MMIDIDETQTHVDDISTPTTTDISTTDTSLNQDSPELPIDDAVPPMLSQYTTLSKSPILKYKTADINMPFMALPNVPFTAWRNYVQQWPVQNAPTTLNELNWQLTAGEAERHLMSGGLYENNDLREGSDWQQTVETDRGVSIHAGKVMMQSNGDGPTKVSSDKALLLMRKELGLGNLFEVPLPHSGFWIKIKPPTDGELSNLERQIQLEKVRLGRETNGILFSNNTVYFTQALYDFILDSIYETNLVNSDVDNLKSLIKLVDFPIMAWALACSIYPKGFDFQQSCVINPDKCQHVVRALLDLEKMFWFDRSQLTDDQRNQLANRRHKFTNDEVITYQNSAKFSQVKRVEISRDNPDEPSIFISLQVPTVERHIRSGDAWINRIRDMILDKFGETISETEMMNALDEQSRLAALRLYGHWIKSIQVNNLIAEDDIDTNGSAVEDILEVLSGDNEITGKVIDEVMKYIDASSIAMIALPSVPCPNCQPKLTESEAKHPKLVPVDAPKLFFTLKDLRLSRMRPVQ